MTKPNDSAPCDHVARLIALRRKESPGVPLDGMEIFARARRLTQLSRPPIEAVFERRGIDAGEFDVLATLQRAGAPYALRPTELYRTLMMSSGGLTDRLNRLEKKGLVAREASSEDKRSMIVKLTPKGRILIEKAFAEDMAAEAALLAPLSKSERRTLAGLLAKLLSEMEKEENFG